MSAEDVVKVKHFPRSKHAIALDNYIFPTYHMIIYILATLGILFITLKLIGVIAWSWLLVLLPFFGIALIYLFVLFLVLFFIYLSYKASN